MRASPDVVRPDQLRRPGVLVPALVALLAIVCGCTVSQPSDGPPRPRVMAALGDSITRAYAACGRAGDCVEASWATGSGDGLDSHAQRLDLATGGTNLAVSGARVADLAAQVQAAVRVRPDYVTVLIGANDACRPDEGAMTSIADYTTTFDAALDALVRQLPDARVLVLSIPDLLRLWEVGKDRPEVTQVWASYGVCQSMLGQPTDASPSAQGQRSRVRARVQAYNAAMATACARHPVQCRYDGGAVFEHRFDLADVSSLDYWHPSRRGQSTVARVAWDAGFWP